MNYLVNEVVVYKVVLSIYSVSFFEGSELGGSLSRNWYVKTRLGFKTMNGFVCILYSLL